MARNRRPRLSGGDQSFDQAQISINGEVPFGDYDHGFDRRSDSSSGSGGIGIWISRIDREERRDVLYHQSLDRLLALPDTQTDKYNLYLAAMAQTLGIELPQKKAAAASASTSGGKRSRR